MAIASGHRDALYAGDAAESRRLLNESLRRCLEQKNTILLARVCTYLAEAALWEGTLDEAEQWLAQSLAYRRWAAPAHHQRRNAALCRRPPGDGAAAIPARRHALWVGRPGAQPDPLCDCRAGARPGRRRVGDGAGSAGAGGLCRGVRRRAAVVAGRGVCYRCWRLIGVIPCSMPNSLGHSSHNESNWMQQE